MKKNIIAICVCLILIVTLSNTSNAATLMDHQSNIRHVLNVPLEGGISLLGTRVATITVTYSEDYIRITGSRVESQERLVMASVDWSYDEDYCITLPYRVEYTDINGSFYSPPITTPVGMISGGDIFIGRENTTNVELVGSGSSGECSFMFNCPNAIFGMFKYVDCSISF